MNCLPSGVVRIMCLGLPTPFFSDVTCTRLRIDNSLIRSIVVSYLPPNLARICDTERVFSSQYRSILTAWTEGSTSDFSSTIYFPMGNKLTFPTQLAVSWTLALRQVITESSGCAASGLIWVSSDIPLLGRSGPRVGHRATLFYPTEEALKQKACRVISPPSPLHSIPIGQSNR